MTGTKLPADGLLDLPADLRPSQLLDPLFANTVQSGPTRALIISLSSSPNTQAICIMALPNGLVLSIACWSLNRAPRRRHPSPPSRWRRAGRSCRACRWTRP